MKLPISEEHEARVKDIRRRLVELAPIRMELEAHLMNVCKEIDSLCREKYAIEQAYVTVQIITTKKVRERSIKEHNHIDPKKALANLDQAQILELIAKLSAVLPEKGGKS